MRTGRAFKSAVADRLRQCELIVAEGEPITVAVVYGAAHVAPAVHGMRALHGYGVRGGEWLTVFDF